MTHYSIQRTLTICSDTPSTQYKQGSNKYVYTYTQAKTPGVNIVFLDLTSFGLSVSYSYPQPSLAQISHSLKKITKNRKIKSLRESSLTHIYFKQFFWNHYPYSLIQNIQKLRFQRIQIHYIKPKCLFTILKAICTCYTQHIKI